MSDVISTEPKNSHSAPPPAAESPVEVFAVYGVEPEIQAYAMAKYSRSSLSMKESLREITAQKAEKQQDSALKDAQRQDLDTLYDLPPLSSGVS